MRRVLLIFAILLAGGAAEAQSTSELPFDSAQGMPRWDVNLTAGFLGARPEEVGSPYGDDWYTEGRYGVSAGYFWTRHFKTELEFATSGEGDRYVTRTVTVPGFLGPYPVNYQQFHRLQQATARAAWQFLDNTWVHPYVNAGFVFDVERRRKYVPEQFHYVGSDPRNPANRVVLADEQSTGPDYEYRRGLALGGGAKFYVSQGAYINTAVQWTYSKPAATFSWIGGFGVEF
jgi:hypothetical protein